MNTLTHLGRIFFAVALFGMGVTHFIFQDFMTGRAPAWPEHLAGGVIWAYVSGISIILLSIAILTKKRGRAAALITAGLILLWPLPRHFITLADSPFLSADWTSMGKALAFFGGSLVIASVRPAIKSNNKTDFTEFLNQDSRFIVLGRICLGIFFLITGFQHFTFTDFVASLIPGWFPGDPVFWTWFGGLALIAGGIGLFIPYTATWAALLSGVMIFSWFWIIHIPRTFASVSDGIAVFEALAVSGIAFAIAGFSHALRTKISNKSDG